MVPLMFLKEKIVLNDLYSGKPFTSVAVQKVQIKTIPIKWGWGYVSGGSLLLLCSAEKKIYLGIFCNIEHFLLNAIILLSVWYI